MKERLERWVRSLVRLRGMIAAHKAEKERLYALWQATSMYAEWDAARQAEKSKKVLAQKVEAKVRGLRIGLFDGLFKGKMCGAAIRVSKPTPVLVIPDSHRPLLKEWMWQNARIYLKIDEEALIGMIEDGEVPAELAWVKLGRPKVTATIAKNLDRELEAKS